MLVCVLIPLQGLHHLVTGHQALPCSLSLLLSPVPPPICLLHFYNEVTKKWRPGGGEEVRYSYNCGAESL